MIELVSQREVQMPCGWLLNQDQMSNGIWWVLVVLQLSNALKSDEKERYSCHIQILAFEPLALISMDREPVLRHDS